jgi:hypothetical protein
VKTEAARQRDDKITRPRNETAENETDEMRGGMRDARREMQEATMTTAVSINAFIVQSNFQTPISK